MFIFCGSLNNKNSCSSFSSCYEKSLNITNNFYNGMSLHLIDYAIIVLYFLFVVGIGFLLKRRMKTGNDFLMSNRSIPLWITSLAFISANLGAQEVLGMAASGAKYGMYTTHYYWLGAAFAMIFLGIYIMLFYYGSRARSLPEY